MKLEIAYYTFEGPVYRIEDLEDRAGVYCILCIMPNGKTFPLDVCESDKMRTSVEKNPQKDCWIENCKGSIAVAVLYTPDQDREGREEIVRKIRAWDYIPCTEQKMPPD